MKYTTTKIDPNNTTHIIEVSPADFKIIMNDSKKKSAFPKNYCNAGFFANFYETNSNGNKQYFTLPVGHLICDFDSKSQWTKHYCNERGKFNGKKFTFDSSTFSYNNSFHKKPLSTLLVNTKSKKAEIKEVVSIPNGYDYAINGVPIMKNGRSVSLESDVKTQGWGGSSLYGTWHIFVGLKKDSNMIYIIGMKTTTWNMVKTNEAYKKFKELDMYDVIKLDGGGSFYMNVSGKAVASTSEDRRVNTIICFGKEDVSNKIDVMDKDKDKDKDIVESNKPNQSTKPNQSNSRPVIKPLAPLLSKQPNKYKKPNSFKMEDFR